MIDAVIDRFGLTRMPFGRDLPPGRLHQHADCAEDWISLEALAIEEELHRAFFRELLEAHPPCQGKKFSRL